MPFVIILLIIIVIILLFGSDGFWGIAGGLLKLIGIIFCIGLLLMIIFLITNQS